ncbi:MAG TPA: FAD-dependent oxidoreductase [Rhizomicrobium sp.]|nr:FAD-dependent oxidoreductase [Rhizomicrobium sp.]
MNHSRRQVLGAAAALPLLAAARGAPQDTDLDVAVVGGGVSGVYTAWRLKRARPHWRVGLFEMSGRIGGRLRSVAFPQAPHLVAEVGGMRFLEAQRHVFNLAKKLNLPMRGYPVRLPADRMLLRGRDLSVGEFGQRGKFFPYAMKPSGQLPSSPLFAEAMARIVPGAGKMNAAQWLKARSSMRYKGRLLKDWSAWALLSDVFTAEEMRFFRDSSGYDDIADYENGLDEFDYLFLADDESRPFFTLAGGYQRLPLALAEEARRLGVEVMTESTLALLQARRDGFALFFTGRRRMARGAKKVVLAMPRRALEPVEGIGDDPRIAPLLATVTPVPACKALLLYAKPWWRDIGIAAGRSVTDMPARQFYALGAETERLASEPANGMGVLMMYSDGPNVARWDELVDPAPAANAGFQWLGPDSQLAAEMHREASLVYRTAPPAPLAACYQDWTAAPYGGGWHYWARGCDGRALAGHVMQPLPGRDLYICGEAYGIYSSGWVEGALERAETMLQKHFGLAKAEWL